MTVVNSCYILSEYILFVSTPTFVNMGFNLKIYWQKRQWLMRDNNYLITRKRCECKYVRDGIGVGGKFLQQEEQHDIDWLITLIFQLRTLIP